MWNRHDHFLLIFKVVLWKYCYEILDKNGIDANNEIHIIPADYNKLKVEADFKLMYIGKKLLVNGA